MTDMVARALALQAKKSKGVNQYSSKYEFPNMGSDGALYIDNTENAIYYWNKDTLSYVTIIASNQDIPKKVQETLETSILHGGNATEVSEI